MNDEYGEAVLKKARLLCLLSCLPMYPHEAFYPSIHAIPAVQQCPNAVRGRRLAQHHAHRGSAH